MSMMRVRDLLTSRQKREAASQPARLTRRMTPEPVQRRTIDRTGGPAPPECLETQTTSTGRNAAPVPLPGTTPVRIEGAEHCARIGPGKLAMIPLETS